MVERISHVRFYQPDTFLFCSVDRILHPYLLADRVWRGAARASHYSDRGAVAGAPCGGSWVQDRRPPGGTHTWTAADGGVRTRGRRGLGSPLRSLAANGARGRASFLRRLLCVRPLASPYPSSLSVLRTDRPGSCRVWNLARAVSMSRRSSRGGRCRVAEPQEGPSTCSRPRPSARAVRCMRGS